MMRAPDLSPAVMDMLTRVFVTYPRTDGGQALRVARYRQSDPTFRH